MILKNVLAKLKGVSSMKNKIITKRRFDGKAENYSLSRPGYSPELFEFFEDMGVNEQSVFADIGAGTGKFSILLLERGYFVYSIEPNADMRSKAIETLEAYPKSIIIDAVAEKTTLPDKCVDVITVAQAFHWFSSHQFKKESSRILKDNGKVMLIWNLINENSNIIQSVKQCMKHYNSNFSGFNAGIHLDKIYYCIPNAQTSIYPYNLTYNRKRFCQRWLSSSFSPNKDMDYYKAFCCDINSIFNKYADNGLVTVENQTLVYVGSPFD
ncbi:class I SAM-dependent methyltransferase [Ruminococcus sp. AF31-14BH]|jgi:ubiquinone/menaquinone biosynthesis C-methylase UbiE|nr:class I SAM-dependent methyltransferase [Ruminococcus sp. AF31-14BH]